MFAIAWIVPVNRAPIPVFFKVFYHRRRRPVFRLTRLTFGGVFDCLSHEVHYSWLVVAVSIFDVLFQGEGNE